MVEAFDKRYVLNVAGDRQEGTVLYRRRDNSATCWHSLDRRGDFRELDLRNYHRVKREPHEGVPLDDMAAPDGAERDAVLRELDRHLQRAAGGGAGGGVEGGGGGDGQRRGDGAARGPPRAPFRRGGYGRRRFVTRMREAGPAKVSGGAAIFGGCLLKFCKSWGAIFIGLREKMKEDSDTGRILKDLYDNSKWWIGCIVQIWETLKDFLKACRDQWDTVLLVLGVLWLIWSWFGAPGSAAYQTARFREEDKRDEEERRQQERHHKESMEQRERHHQDQLRRAAGGGSSSSSGGDAGGGGVFADLGGHEKVRDGDKTAAAGVTKEKESVVERISRLIRGAKSPIDKLVNFYKAFHVVTPWTMPAGLQESHGDRLPGDVLRRWRRCCLPEQADENEQELGEE